MPSGKSNKLIFLDIVWNSKIKITEIDKIIKNQKPEPGSYTGRKNSEPENNRTTLIETNNAPR